jgi:D-ribose pyranase
MIADCGLPIPNGVKKIDLALDFSFHLLKSFFRWPYAISQYEIHLRMMVYQNPMLASEMKTENESLYNVLKEEEIKFTTESHELLKQHFFFF